MWRVLVTTWIVYGCGHPVLDGYRPAVFDRALQLFHENVNTVVLDGRKGLASLGESSVVRYLKGSVSRVDAQLRPDGK